MFTSMIFRAGILIFFFLMQFLVVPALAKVDDSLDIFFPKSLKYLQYSQSEFPVFWWNFLIIDANQGIADFSKAQKICESLREFRGHEIKHLICSDDLSDEASLLSDWAKDLILREPFTSIAALRPGLQSSLAELSYMSSTNQVLFNLKRVDPLDQWQIYLQKTQALSSGHFQRKNGYLLDPASQKIILPVQFSVMPKMSAVEAVAARLQSFDGVHWVGAHSSAFSNEKQVHRDLDTVSVVGILVLIGFILFLVFKGRLAALLIFPPVGLAMLLAAALVEFIDGSIHGLTLAFGSGIIGLAVDYGLHGTFNAESRQTWKSNSIGLLTTLVALLVLAMSGIPLLRQMMIFASSGICFAFLIFFGLCRYWPRFFQLKYIQMPFFDFRGSGILILLLMLYGVGVAFSANLNFDIRKFNFQPAGDAEATQWFFSQGENKETFLLLHDEKQWKSEPSQEQSWSAENHIQYEGLGAYLPDVTAQENHEKSWTGTGCASLKKELSPVETKVFSPFLENLCAGSRVATDFASVKNKTYLQHLLGQNQFVSIFFAKGEAEEKMIREHFPEAHSLVESVKGFSQSLSKDLQWMIPLVLLLCSLILGFYYRNLWLVMASYIPFLSGVGLFWLVKSMLHEELDMISILGLLMVFGFSVDYAVFVTDIFAFAQDKKKLEIVYSVLTLAAITNVIGFFPLLLAKHPILHQLGFVLVFGTMGTYIGTRWGLEKFLQRWDSSQRKNHVE